MKTKHCDVVGCKQAACWICPAEVNGAADDYLCQEHYDPLTLTDPEQATCYSPMEESVEAELGTVGLQERKLLAPL